MSPRRRPGASRPLWQTTGTVHPHRVPVFPVIPLEVTGTEQALLAGRPVPVPAGSTPAGALVEAAAAQARSLPGLGETVRVRATGPDGRTHLLAVDVGGRLLRLERPRRPRPAWLWPLVAAVSAVALSVGVAGTVLLHSRPRTSTPVALTAPPPSPLGRGANLPLAPPPGFAGRAAWAVPVHPRVPPIVTSGGTVLALTGPRDVALLDPGTGRVVWRCLAPEPVTALHLTRIDARRVVAVGSGGSLTYWPLPETPPRRPAAGAAVPSTRGVTVPLPRRGRLLWTPGSPLVELPDQTAAVLTPGGTERLDLPVGAVPAAARDRTVLALSTAGRWWHLLPGRSLPRGAELPAPRGATGPPLRTVALDVDHVLAVWPAPGGRQVATLQELGSPLPSATLRVPGTTDAVTTPLVAQPDGGWAAVGPLLADAEEGTLTLLGRDLVATAVVPGHVYARDARSRSVDVTVSRGRARAQLMGEDGPGVPLGVISPQGSASLALVLAQKVEEHLLYALPRLTGRRPPTPGHESTKGDT